MFLIGEATSRTFVKVNTIMVQKRLTVAHAHALADSLVLFYRIYSIFAIGILYFNNNYL